jgi:hypothetical protein
MGTPVYTDLDYKGTVTFDKTVTVSGLLTATTGISLSGVSLTVHDRQHAMDSVADHAAASAANFGKFLRANPSTGMSEWYALDSISGVIAHDKLSELGDDDHTQYLRTDGIRSMTGVLTMQNNIKLGLNNKLLLDADENTYLIGDGNDTFSFYVGAARSLQLTTAILNSRLRIINDSAVLKFGNDATTGHSLVSGDAIFGGSVEFDAAVWIDNGLIVGTRSLGSSGAYQAFGGQVTSGSTSDSFLGVYNTENQLVWTLGQRQGRHLVIGDTENGLNKNYDHAAQTDPALFIHSVTNPDSNNTQWLGMYHNQTNGVIETGTGGLNLTPAGGLVTVSSALSVGSGAANALRFGSQGGLGTSADGVFQLTATDGTTSGALILGLSAGSHKPRLNASTLSNGSAMFDITDTSGGSGGIQAQTFVCNSGSYALLCTGAAEVHFGMAGGMWWSNNSSGAAGDLFNVGMRRDSAGVIQVYGAAGAVQGSIKLLNLVPSGQIYPQSLTTNTPTGITQTIDFATGNAQVLSLASATGNVTVTLSNAQAGATYLIKIIQHASSAKNITWPATVEWVDGIAPTISTGASAIDIVSFFYDGTNFFGNVGQNYF